MHIEPIAADGTIRIKPIGAIRSAVDKQQTGGFESVQSWVELRPEFADFLLGIDDYSHLAVVYWLSEQTAALPVTRPQGNPDVPEVGMFACR